MVPHDIEARVREIVENAIGELQAFGMAKDQALTLLLIQAAIRIEDAATVRAALGPLLDDD